MPTYQYACTACGEQLEAVQSFSDASLTECPACSGTLRKVFSAVGVVFKGSGFYKTDSRSSSAKGSGSSESKSSDDKGSETKGSETKSETSSSGKSETKGDAPAKAAPKAESSSSSSSTPVAKSA